ncbi:MAG TPA: DegT/DnrJ/EryC1/StrS family aminotransferase [Candidatus Limnocylindrales bacterium]|nr:DegT/DnrJ/EryC1/StrS family aminotransferase [Candidatus Limnocylindrales bacterium]
MPGPGVELIGDEEIAEVLEVLTSRFLSRYGPSDDPAFGAKCRRVEQEIAALAGVRYGLGLSGGGSSSIWLALLGLGIGPGDEVIVPGFTFVASISAIVYARAVPVLAEIDDTFNLDPADVEARITPRTRAILVVHMLGAPARLNELKAIADRHGIALVEDCAQAFGASYRGQGVGGIGTIGAYSFNEYKTITCGDGGMIVTDDRSLYERCFSMHDQGHAPDRLESKYAERPFLGMNMRMTELSGAVLLAQVRKLDAIRSHLRANKAIAKSVLADLPGLGFRVLADPDGDLATHLVVTFPSADIAGAVAAEVGSITLERSGWHVYSNMEHVLERRTITGKGCPFDCACSYDTEVVYRRGMLPRTDELLARSISFGIGVFDTNLAPFGLRMRDDGDVARARAAQFRDVAARHLAVR